MNNLTLTKEEEKFVGDFVRLNGNFDKAFMELRACHNREVKELRDLYFNAQRQIRKLRAEIKTLKGEKNGG